MAVIVRISLSSLLAITTTAVALYILACIVFLLCSASHRYLIFRGHLKRRQLLLEQISELYERILAIEAANRTKKLWNGGMDEATAKKAMDEISRLKMAEAA